MKTITACVGITNGSSESPISWHNFLASFRLDPIVCPEGRESLVLQVDGYEPPQDEGCPPSKPVRIELRRASGQLLYVLHVDNITLCGRPEVRWEELEVR